MIDISGENVVLVGALLLFVAVMAGKVAYRFGAPALLLFLGVGMLFGLNFISYRSVEMTQFVGMIALCIILFTGGMDTKFSEIKPIIGPGVVLATVGVVMTAFVLAGFVWLVAPWLGIEIPFALALLLASTMSSTDSASVFSILRSKKQGLKQNLRPLLELESGSNDPMAYMLTIVLIQFIQSAGMGVGAIVGSFVIQFMVGAGAGYVLGKLAIRMLNKLNIDNQALYPILLLAFVFFTFSITDLLKGNGYLAVYIAGIMVGNNKIMHRKDIYTFMDGLTWLFQIIMFLCLGLLVNPHEMLEVAAVALLIGVFMIIIGRPLSVFLCLLPFRKITMKSRIFVSWVGLRGAVPIIFATYPVVAGVEGSNLIFNIVFFITIVSLVVQGTTISFVARILNLSKPLEKTGNDFGVELPEEIDSDLSDMTITKSMLEEADTLKDMNLPKGTLVMIVKRGDEFLIPNGTLKLHEGDKLLLISEKSKEEDTDSE